MKLLVYWTCLSVCPMAIAGSQWTWLGQQSFSSFVTGSLSAINAQVTIARRFLRSTPPVSEPPPALTALCRPPGPTSCELHTVRTDDGFLLTAVRIPSSLPDAVPALVLHGNLATSDSWLLRKDDSNLGAVLNEAGYDVWLGNLRGNTHSKQHVMLNATDEAFWNWSFHEIGLYDVPALVDYILAKTRQQDVHVLGHSMSTAAILVTLSERPEYNKKVRFAGLMGPAVRQRGALELFYQLLFYRFRSVALEYMNLAQMWEIAPRSPIIHFIADLFCVENSPFLGLCNFGLELVLGASHPKQRIPNYLATIAAYHPAGTSFRLIDHYGAINLSGRFRPLGKGIYDPNPPPDYNMSAITAPVGLYHSTNDLTMDAKDVDRLGRSLPNLKENYLVPLKQFNHLDFMWAKDVRGLLYNHIIQTMKELDSL